MNFFKRKSPTTQNQNQGLHIEPLEERLMLSTVEVFAAGATGEENLNIFINGQFETAFF